MTTLQTLADDLLAAPVVEESELQTLAASLLSGPNTKEIELQQRIAASAAEIEARGRFSTEAGRREITERATVDVPAGNIPPIISVRNPDGGFSSERTKSFSVEELNGGRETLIPTLVNGKQLTDEEAIRDAIGRSRRGVEYPSFDTVEEAEAFAASRSERGGAGTQGFLGTETPLRPFQLGIESKGFGTVSELDILNQQRTQRGLPPVDEVPGELTASDITAFKASNIPFYGAAADAVDLWNLHGSAKRAEEGTATLEDWERIADFQEQVARSGRGMTFGAGVKSILSQSAPFMVEFLASGGVSTVLKTGGKKLAIKGLSNAIEKMAIKAGASKVGRVAVGGAKLAGEAALRLPAFSGRIAKGTAENMLGTFNVEAGEGDEPFEFVVTSEGQSIDEAVKNATFDTYIEVFSEMTGKALAGVGRFVRKSLGIEPVRVGARKFAASLGFHGVIEEMGEERVGEALREIATRLGIADLPQEFPSVTQLAQEFVAFSVPGGGVRFASWVINNKAKAQTIADTVNPEAKKGQKGYYPPKSDEFDEAIGETNNREGRRQAALAAQTAFTLPTPLGQTGDVEQLGDEARAVASTAEDSLQAGETSAGEIAHPALDLQLNTQAQSPQGPTPDALDVTREETQPNTDAGGLIDQWHGDRDVSKEQARVQASVREQEIMGLTGSRTPDAAYQELEKAINLHVDLRNAEERGFGTPAEQLNRYGGKVSQEQRDLFDRSQNLSPQEQTAAEQFIAENRALGIEAQDATIIGNYYDNYTPRIWQTPKGRVQRSVLARFTTTTPRAKARRLESILHGWSLGYKLKVEGATTNQRVAREAIAQVIHDRNLMDTGIDAGVFDTKQHDDWVRVEHPNFRKWKLIGSGKKVSEFAGRNVRVTPDGAILERQDVFAPPDIAKHLNNALGTSKLFNIRGVEELTKFNDVLKHMLLTTSLFHHQAFMRSFLLAGRVPTAEVVIETLRGMVGGLKHIVKGNPLTLPFRAINPFGLAKAAARNMSAFQAGKVAVEGFIPELRELVRAGMTLGRQQDWDELSIARNGLISNVLSKIPIIAPIAEKLRILRDAETAFLFNELGPYLKTQVALLEFRDLLRKNEQALLTGTKTREQLAAIAANVANDDFGGLNLERLGRNPELQHIFRLFALAPDWTESNVRSMVKAFGRGEEARVYQALWARVALKGLGATVLFNLSMAGMGDDQRKRGSVLGKFWDNLRRAWNEGNLRWLDVDVTPIYHALGGDSEKRKYFSLVGHFKDPVKFALHPLTSAKHKGSVLSRIAFDAISGSDYAGRRFTTLPELIGKDDKGVYKTTTKKHAKGDTKGGQLFLNLVSKDKGTKTLQWIQIPSWLAYEARNALPIQAQQGIAFLQGEIDAFDAITKSVGAMTATTYPSQDARRAIQRGVDLKDTDQARASLDRLEQEEGEKGRKIYEGSLLYKMSNKEGDVGATDTIEMFEMSDKDKRRSFNAYWRSRKFNIGSDSYLTRRRKLGI